MFIAASQLKIPYLVNTFPKMGAVSLWVFNGESASSSAFPLLALVFVIIFCPFFGFVFLHFVRQLKS